MGVGSDTTQAVLNQFSTDYNAFLGASSTLPRLYSWDATGTSPIVTKTGATTPFNRPNGSSAADLRAGRHLQDHGRLRPLLAWPEEQHPDRPG